MLGKKALSVVVSALVAVSLCPAAALAAPGASSEPVQADVAAHALAPAKQAAKAKAQAAAKAKKTAKAKSKKKSPERYSYSIRPLIKPFSGYFYVKTANPNPTTFRFVDKKSRFMTEEGKHTVYDGHEPGVVKDVGHTYRDVKYVKAKTRRVKGGYIFCDPTKKTDGGNLVLQVKKRGVFVDTKKKVKCPALKTRAEYIVAKYTKSKKGFWSKMNAAQSALSALAVYPTGVCNASKRSKSTPYPLLAASVHVELGLNEHVNVFQGDAKGSLLVNAYPFDLDSYSFPLMLSSVASKLGYKYTASWNAYAHHLIDFTYNGKTNSYGGAGNGSSTPVQSKRIKKTFTFKGGTADCATNNSLDKWCRVYLDYSKSASKDAKRYSEQVRGEAFNKKVAGGTWIRVAREGEMSLFYGYFAYYASSGNGSTRLISDAWVDGRYIDDFEVFVPGAKFADHPTADIVKRGMTFTDKEGKTRTEDVTFSYDPTTDTWRAPRYYSGSWFTEGEELPAEFVLTRVQVKAMNVDANADRPPKSGLVYDGQKAPGTKFSVNYVTGMTMSKKKATLYLDKRLVLKPKISPANATYDRVTWTSSDESVAHVNDYGQVHAYKAGKVTITARALDGGYTATCKVTVKNPVSISRAKVKLSKTRYAYNGKQCKPKVTVKVGGKTLKRGRDYDIAYWGNSGRGIATVHITGKGAYTGSITASYKIV